ncbi:hypothetical protein [Comamonas sp. NoAH]|uniref:hypothetical protein n=1 Tax=Comamonas halotolerans TaxID=3041496 RepID=UPI0024E17327|nr:hypothetical protein [Comamonas sp. NoAH]
MPVRKKKSVPQRLIQQRPPLTPMHEPLNRAEVQRLQAHMRKHGPRSLTPRQHDAVWDFLFDVPESQAWLADMATQTQAAQAGLRPRAKTQA